MYRATIFSAALLLAATSPARAQLAEPEGSGALAGTEGSALDHVGFETANLRALIAHLESEGIELDEGYRAIGDTNIAIAFLTDPWGTYIELTENLEP